jgi:hypothetical protein
VTETSTTAARPAKGHRFTTETGSEWVVTSVRKQPWEGGSVQVHATTAQAYDNGSRTGVYAWELTEWATTYGTTTTESHATPTVQEDTAMTATAATAVAEAIRIETGRYSVARISGRYRVVDNGGAVLVTVSSKAAGQKWIDRKVQDAADAAEAATAERETRRQEAIAAQAAEDATVAEAIAAAVPEEASADARQARAAELAEAVAAGDVSFDAAAAELLGGAPVAPLAVVTLDGQETTVEATATPAAKPAKAKDDTVAYRIGKILREWVLANEARYAPALVEHIKGRNVCYDDTATLRLSAAWAAELSAAATDVENAALSGEFQAKAPAVMAARAARKGLAKLF